MYMYGWEYERDTLYLPPFIAFDNEVPGYKGYPNPTIVLHSVSEMNFE